MCHNITRNSVKVMLASAFLDYAGIVIFVFKAYSACPATQNAVSLLDFAEIVSSPWVHSHTQMIIIFVTLFFLSFIF